MATVETNPPPVHFAGAPHPQTHKGLIIFAVMLTTALSAVLSQSVKKSLNVLSETVASNRGIGNVMMTASSNFNVPLVFAGLFVLAGLGVALYVIFSLIEGRVTGWATRKNDVIAT